MSDTSRLEVLFSKQIEDLSQEERLEITAEIRAARGTWHAEQTRARNKGERPKTSKGLKLTLSDLGDLEV